MAGSPPSRGALGLLITIVGTGVVLMRVALVVGVAMVLFLIAFLGYFVLPFIFVLIALGILSLTPDPPAVVRLWGHIEVRER